MTNAEYNQFISTGVVSKENIENIAILIKENKTLSLEQQAVFFDKTKEINKILIKLKTSSSC